jgi:hypothetical protein
MNSFFVGDKRKPSFLVEVIKKQKQIIIYKPDKYSQNEEFYEKYSLGKLLLQTKYDNIIFVKKPVPYKQKLFVPEIIFKIKNKCLIVSKTIKEKDFIAHTKKQTHTKKRAHTKKQTHTKKRR